MKLHWSPRSPFVRKVMIVLHETGLLDEVERIRSVVAIDMPPNQQVLADNPLGKIPVLVTDDGKQIFDSRVICEFLDARAGTGLFPSENAARMDQLCWQALADGMTDILLLWRTELTRETGPWTRITDGWRVKVRSSMARLEQDAEALGGEPFGIGHIAIACALGQLDFRWPSCQWRDHFPKLTALEAGMSQRASVQATQIKDDQDGGAGEVTSGHLTFGKKVA